MKIKNPNLHLDKLKALISRVDCNSYTDNIWCTHNEMYTTIAVCLARKLGYTKYGIIDSYCKKCKRLDMLLLDKLKEEL